jgi:hypothetical protein
MLRRQFYIRKEGRILIYLFISFNICIFRQEKESSNIPKWMEIYVPATPCFKFVLNIILT